MRDDPEHHGADHGRGTALAPAGGGAAATEVFRAFCAAGLWPGLGRTTAGRLADAGIRRPADVDYAALVTIEGVSPARARRLVDSFREAAGTYAVAELLTAAGLPVRLARSLGAEFGSGALDALRDDPWALLTPGEADLGQADRLARHLGSDRSDPRRGPAVLVYLLHRAGRAGDTAAPADALLRAAARDGVADPPAALAEAAASARVVVSEPEWDPEDDEEDGPGVPGAHGDPGAAAEAGPTLVALERFAMAETDLAEGIARLLATASPLRGRRPRAGAGGPDPSAAAADPEPVEPPPSAQEDMFAAFGADDEAGNDRAGNDRAGDGGAGDADPAVAGPGPAGASAVGSGAAGSEGPGSGGPGSGPAGAGGEPGRAGAAPSEQDIEAAAERALAGLDESQRRAARAVLNAGVSLLTGGPGTGKSRTVAAVVAIADAAGARVVLAAPTGRAAKRLEELAGRPAGTLHRTLGAQGREGGFTRNEHNPLEADLVVVDEVSMLDAELAAALVEACSDGTHLLLVGDPAQLPSIGPGQVLADLLATPAVEMTELTRLYRQAEGGAIATLASAVRAGQLPPPPPGPGREVVVVPARGSGEAAHRTVQLVTDSIPRALGIEAADIQVVTPVHKGDAGTVALNAALKAALNPGPGRASGFDVGDRVVATANHLDLGFANGEVGTVVGLADRGGLHIAFTGARVEVPVGALGDIRHGWAVTVHRAQGSEWPAVVAVFPPEAGGMLTRPLVYTALTRARSHLSIVSANGPALRQAVARGAGRGRRTLLPRLLREAVG